MPEISSIPLLAPTYKLMAFFIIVFELTHRNKMVWQNQKTNTLLKLHTLFYSPPMFLKDFGEMLSPVPTATYLINRMPSRILIFKTPCQTFLEHHSHTPLISEIPFRVFGCSIFVHIHSHDRGKLDAKTNKCIFLCYSPNKRGYKCYCPRSKKFFHSMDVTFLKNQPFYPISAIQREILQQELQN